MTKLLVVAGVKSLDVLEEGGGYYREHGKHLANGMLAAMKGHEGPIFVMSRGYGGQLSRMVIEKAYLHGATVVLCQRGIFPMQNSWVDVAGYLAQYCKRNGIEQVSVCGCSTLMKPVLSTADDSDEPTGVTAESPEIDMVVASLQARGISAEMVEPACPLDLFYALAGGNESETYYERCEHWEEIGDGAREAVMAATRERAEGEKDGGEEDDDSEEGLDYMLSLIHI